MRAALPTEHPSRITGVWERHDPTAPPVPVILDSPHSGANYPEDFRHAVTHHALRSAEDMYVDDLFAGAMSHGATLLCALFPRSYIDVNRRPLDLDADLLSEPWPEPLAPGSKTRSGKGLIRTRAKGHPLYDRKLSVNEVQTRLEDYYAPYHGELDRLTEEMHAAFGALWHVNCHSWTPPSKGRNGGPIRPIDFCLGDHDGTTCDPEFTALAAAFLEDRGYAVRVNRPFKGMELIRRHGRPSEERHSLQIEISRDLYMDKHSYARLDGFESLQQDLTDLIGVICAFAQSRILQTPSKHSQRATQLPGKAPVAGR